MNSLGKYPILDYLLIPEKMLTNWQTTVDLLADMLDIPSALIMRVHAQEIEVFTKSNNNENIYKLGETAPLDTGLYCETVMSTQRELLVPNALKDPLWEHNPDIDLGMIVYCGLPLTWPTGEIFGTLCILDNKTNNFSQHARDLLERFQGSIQYNLANIFETSQKESIYLKTEQKNQELEAKYGSLIKSIPAVTYTAQLDENSTTLFVSEQIISLIGFTPAEYKSNHDIWFQQLHPDDRERVLQETHEAQKSNLPLVCEYRMFDRKGNIKWVRDEAYVVKDNTDTPVCLQGVMYDITKLKQSEEALATSEQRFKLAMMGSNDGLYDWDLKTDKVYYSPHWKSMLGYGEQELDNTLSTWESLIDPEDKKRSWTMLREYMDGKKDNFHLEFKMCHKDGHWVEILSRAYLVRDDKGVPIRIVGTHIDITERNNARRIIETQRNRAQQYLDIVSDILVVLDDKGKVIMINAKGCEILGLHEDEILGLNWFDNFIPKSNREEVIGFFKQLMAGEIEPVEYAVNPIINTQGVEHLISWHNTVTRDTNDEITGILSSGEDITERKQTEEHLQLMLHALDEVEEATYLIDEHANFIYANQGAVRHLGYSQKELQQMTVINLMPDYSMGQWKIHWQELKEHGSLTFEVIHQRKDGTTFPVEINANYIDYHGEKFNLAFVRNIQERKQLEQISQLRQNLGELIYRGDQNLLLQTVLDIAEEMTDSQIGFFHFVKDDQETISLQVWSTRTLNEMCFAEGNGLHYPISDAGIWVDCIYQRQAVIHNDYESQPHKKGLPEGHAKLLRELTVPVLSEGKIIAVIGVGNKQVNYTQDDLALVTQIAEIGLDYLQRVQAKQQVEYMAYYDVLTNLPNRALLHDRFHHDIALTQRNNKLLAVCYLDLDGFKPINDRYGHDIGDQLLKIIAGRLNKTLREGDTLARIGGDEFVMLLTGLSTIQECEEVIHRVLDTINNPVEIENHGIHVTASIGITVFPTDNTDLDSLLRHADQAMYQAKAAGKSVFHFYDPVQDQNLQTHRKMLQEFEIALHNQQLVLHYQPKIDLRNGQVIGVEALVRWQHPENGLLYPGVFLPIIEGTPQEIALGEWVLRSALEQHMYWIDSGLTLKVSVNISPRHMQIKGFVDFLKETLSHYPEHVGKNLELEILETTSIDDMSIVADIMTACSNLGIHFSLDDFGTGYSSLTYFHHLPIDVLKIDQNFVKDMLDDSGDLDIVEGVLRLAETLQRPVVAEGVESIELGVMLLQLGCQYAQGYGIARPMAAQEIPNWINQWQYNHIWHQLPKETSGALEDFALNVAIFSLHHWFEMLSSYLNDEAKAKIPPMNDQTCPFWRWYKGVGRVRYGNRPSYAFLSPKHSQIHEFGNSLVAQAKAGNRVDALSDLTELEVMCNDLTDLLHKLSSQ
ncbi:MAG: EAL domain-containing protein [gamma proteobacterium symbiont of Taylorina sp.]|nr:EAL domain-containing protein [gamma proteobacterium symbiont of Taylorina sp.]